MLARASVLALASLLLSACAADADSSDPSACKFTPRVSEVGSFGALPMPIRDYLKPKFNFDDPHTGGIAPKGGKWNATDVVTRDAPFRRFMRAGYAGDKWFLWWERGGIAYWRQFAVFALQGGNVIVMAHGSLPSETPCAATEAAMDGRLPTGGETPW
jgi:hypothetical protein